MDKLCVFVYMLINEGRESETKDSPSQFSELFQREKSAHYTQVNTVVFSMRKKAK